MNQLQHTALSWYAKHISVLPVLPRSKKAAVKWHDLQENRVRWPTVRDWFQNPHRNLGILCGDVSQGLVVLDFDEPGVYNNWTGFNQNLAKSYTVVTARGKHVYLFCEETPERTFAMRGVDVKASGYVLTAPSLHPSGIRYEVVNNNEILSIGEVQSALTGLAGPKMEGVGQPYADARQEHDLPLPFSANVSLAEVKLYSGVARDIKAKLSIFDCLTWYTPMTFGNGGYWWGLCPAHDDHEPSLSCSMERGRAHCWSPSCLLHSRRGFDVIDVVGRLEGLSPRDAMATLAVRLALVSD